MSHVLITARGSLVHRDETGTRQVRMLVNSVSQKKFFSHKIVRSQPVLYTYNEEVSSHQRVSCLDFNLQLGV
jgi:hypothetical protein